MANAVKVSNLQDGQVGTQDKGDGNEQKARVPLAAAALAVPHGPGGSPEVMKSREWRPISANLQSEVPVASGSPQNQAPKARRYTSQANAGFPASRRSATAWV